MITLINNTPSFPFICPTGTPKTPTLNTGLRLFTQQFIAMFLKRVLNSWRSPLITLVQFAVPIVFTILGCMVKYMYESASHHDPEPLVLSQRNLDAPVSPFAGRPFTWFFCSPRSVFVYFISMKIVMPTNKVMI